LEFLTSRRDAVVVVVDVRPRLHFRLDLHGEPMQLHVLRGQLDGLPQVRQRAGQLVELPAGFGSGPEGFVAGGAKGDDL
jgi:hypothetical protein